MSTITMLTDIETKEVSLVKRGANRKKIALTKSENPMKNILEAVLGTEAEGEVEIITTLKTANVSEKGLEAATGLFRLLTSFKDELNSDGVSSIMKAAGFVAEVPEPIKKADPAPDLTKLDPAAREAIAKSEASSKEAIEKADRLEKQLGEERDLRLVKDWTEKAETLFSHIPAKSTELAILLKSLTPEISESLEKVLKDANEAIKSGELLASKGRAYTLKGGGAWDSIVTGAKQLIEKSSETISQAKAVDLFLVTPEGKDLYQQYLSENNAQTGHRS